MYPLPDDSLRHAVLLFITGGFGASVSMASATLFWIAYRFEHKLHTWWRAWGFLLLAVASSAAVASLMNPRAAMAGLWLEAAAFGIIWYGVKREPLLTPLRTVATYAERQRSSAGDNGSSPLHKATYSQIYLTPPLTKTAALLGAAGSMASLGFIIATLRLQAARYRTETGSAAIEQQNLYPLLAYVFLAAYATLQAAALILSSSLAWYLSIITALLGYGLLAAWAWIFIRVRPQLKISVQFLVLAAGASAIVVFACTLALFYLLARLLAALPATA